MKKIPYGISSYDKIKSENYYFVDKTKYIEIIEGLGSPYLFFLRPRRFGKSLFISILHEYYDICAKENFDKLFGDTYIGKNPTPAKNSYPVLRFNFSMIPTDGNIEEIKYLFQLNILSEITVFINKYAQLYNLNLSLVDELKKENSPGAIFLIFSREMNIKDVRFYLIIDEYDNFGNNILTQHGPEVYKQSTHSGGFLRSFFTIIKGLTDNREIDRLFITGVAPLVMADVTSGFNIGDNISLDSSVSEMVGLTLPEVKQILEYYQSFHIFKDPIESIITVFDQWYNGYSFCNKFNKIYNTVSVLYYINQYIKEGEQPNNLIDENLRTDYGKLRFLLFEEKKLNGNFSIMKEIAETKQCECNLSKNFPYIELIDKQKFKSLLYYLGFLSVKEINFAGNYIFTIPNKLIDNLLWGYIRKAIDEYYSLNIDVDFVSTGYTKMATEGTWKPIFKHIIDKFYEAVSIRDFVFHEEGLKTFLLAWLNLTTIYNVLSEKEMNKGYSDIILEPSRRFVEHIKFDYIIELKFVNTDGISTIAKEKASIQQAKTEAVAQLNQYSINQKFKTTKVVIIASPRKLLWMDEV